MQQNHSRSFPLVGVTDFRVFEVGGFHGAKLGFIRKGRKVFSQSVRKE
jgi:hypothetical protein